MKYTILGDEVKNEAEFKRLFQGVTGYNLDTFLTICKSKGKPSETIHTHHCYQYITKSIHSAELKYIKVSKPFNKTKVYKGLVIAFVVIAIICMIPALLIIGVCALVKKDFKFFKDKGDQLAEVVLGAGDSLMDNF